MTFVDLLIIECDRGINDNNPNRLLRSQVEILRAAGTCVVATPPDRSAEIPVDSLSLL